MKINPFVAAALCVVAVGGAAVNANPVKSPLDFTMKSIDGKDVKLAKYKGNVVLVVNTASKCGLTPQYAKLEELYKKYKDKGLRILAFPANNFGAQEPGTDSQIKEFCSLNYKVSFDLFSKISVKGSDIHPLYQYLTTQPKVAGDVEWNFAKFLVDRKGNLVGRFKAPVDPTSEEVVKAIEAALAAK
ncbi:MAG: glutathione peroxidase [Armatimonadaceae bacterium]